MCQMIKIKRDAVPSNITIEFERDASLRAVAIVVINHNCDGEEVEGVKLIAQDNGKFYAVGTPKELRNGVDLTI